MDEFLPTEKLLVRYLDNEMSGEEKKAFEMRLQTDPSLSEELESLRIAREAITLYGLRMAVREASEQRKTMLPPSQTQQPARIIRMNRRLRFAFAIASCLVLLIGGIVLYKTSAPSPESIYQEAYVSYNLTDTRAAGTHFTPVEQAYQQKNYQEVLHLAQLQKLAPEELLLSGIAALESHKTTLAISYLTTLAGTDDLTYRQDAEYYLALAYLANKDYQKALPLFRKIAGNPEHLYHHQITENAVRELEDLGKD
jgi:tetratricopeptide (TPR) repeat protein